MDSVSRHKIAKLAVRFLAIPLVVFATACSEQDTLGVSATHDPAPGDDPLVGHFVVCKVGTSATFDVTVDGVTTQLNLTAGACDTVARVRSSLPGQTATVTVFENVPANAVLDSVKVKTCVGLVCNTTTGNNPTVARTLTNDNGFEVTFFNRMLVGGQGCTPGYWKQPHHFDSWVPTGYSPNQALNSVFTGGPAVTLVQGLGLNGGGVNALTRHAVAALLNAAHPGVSYDLSPAAVIAAYNAAVAGGNVEGTKNMFAGFNEQGCTLN